VSIERVQRQGGAVWRVRWRDELNRERSKVLGTKRDAEAFDAEIRRRKRTGELARGCLARRGISVTAVPV